MGNGGIDSGGSVGNNALDEVALSVTSTEEGQVNEKQYPTASGEGECRQDKTQDQGQFERSDKRHAGIVISLHKLADGISKWR